MNIIKKLLNLKPLSIVFVLYAIYTAGVLYFSAEELETYKSFYFSGLGFFITVIFAPITEEIIFRYWAYGKNLRLQFAFLFTFILYIIIDFIQDFIYPIFYFSKIIEINLIFRNMLVIFIGLLIFYYFKKINFKVPNFFSKFTQTRFTFLLILFIFEGVHWYNVDFNYEYLPTYLIGFIASYLITRNARELGIYFAILIHIAYNITAELYNLLIIRTEAKNFVSDQLLLNYALVSIFFVTLYLVQIVRAKPRTLIQR